MKTALAVLVALLVAPVAAAQEPPLPADTVARVQQTPILKAELDHWIEVASAAAGQPPPSPGTKDYAQVRDQVMQLVTLLLWIEGEARERGITVSDAGVRARFERQKRMAFPTEADYQRYLARSTQTEADILRRTRADILAERLRDKVTAPAHTPKGEQRLLDRFVKHFTAKWRRRTVCGEPYAMDSCGRTLPIAAAQPASDG